MWTWSARRIDRAAVCPTDPSAPFAATDRSYKQECVGLVGAVIGREQALRVV